MATQTYQQNPSSADTAAMVPRSEFPLLAGHPAMHYLDSAATSQKPRAVLDALVGFYETANANPHRGAYALSAAALYLLGAELKGMYPQVPLMLGVGIGIALISYNGVLCWGFNADAVKVPDLADFVGAIRASAQRVAEACEVKLSAAAAA